MIDTKDMVIIGTSGSLDYLNDSTAGQRFWRVEHLPRVEQDPCDGIHDESAPTSYLCTRCFPQAVGSPIDEASFQDDPEEIE